MTSAVAAVEIIDPLPSPDIPSSSDPSQLTELALPESTEKEAAETDTTATPALGEISDKARPSVSSVDSSISLSYDALPFTPRSPPCTSSTDEESHKPVPSADARTSSDNAEEQPFEPPDEELTKKIVNQVEFYFADENIVKDAFLLKHVRRNKEGFVSLKLIASFKRVKHIARDWRVVRAALATSTKLELNEAATKLRRKDPLPSYDQTTPSRTVVAFNIPAEQATIERIAEMFRTCGEIALVRILRPGNPIPSDVRSFYNKHSQMQEGVSALIEFVRTESAHNALNREPNTNSPIQVVELNALPSKKRPQGRKGPSRTIESDFSSSCQSGSEAEDKYKLRLQQRRFSDNKLLNDHWSQRRWSRDSGTESSSSSNCRSRSNSGAYFVPEPRRLSNGWDSSSDSYSSCRSRSNSGASTSDIFHMRRYSLPRKDAACCCCEHTNGRRYSIGRGSDEGLSQCTNGENCLDRPYRRESTSEFYTLPRGSSFERRPSFSRPSDGQWSRSNSFSSSDSSRRLSDADSRLALIRQRSFGNGIAGHPAAADSVVRLPRGPDGGRGFQREIIEYALPE